MSGRPTGGYVQDTCLIGQGERCCRYIMVDGDGFFCAKNDPDGEAIIARSLAGMTSQGDNCKGYNEEGHGDEVSTDN